MIVDLILAFCDWLLGLLSALLPDAALDFPDVDDVASWFGQFAGPVDRFFPVYELAVFLQILLGVWVPVALAYTLAKWLYRHFPILGKG